MKQDKFFRFNQISPIDKIMDTYLSQMGMDNKMRQFRSVEEYNNLEQDDRLNSNAVNISKGKLIVETDNSATSNLLSLKKSFLIKKINEKIRKKFIKDIIFIVSKKGDSLE